MKFQSINLEQIEKGQFAAIVGPSGKRIPVALLNVGADSVQKALARQQSFHFWRDTIRLTPDGSYTTTRMCPT